MPLNIALTENTIFFGVNLDYKLKRTVKKTYIIDCLSDVVHHVDSKLLEAAVVSGKTSNTVVRRPSQCEQLEYLENSLS